MYIANDILYALSSVALTLAFGMAIGAGVAWAFTRTSAKSLPYFLTERGRSKVSNPPPTPAQVISPFKRKQRLDFERDLNDE